MKLIKLNAIDSTNTFLKQLVLHEVVENFTVVSAEHQTKGRGQRGAEWSIESGKNLTFSVLYKQLTKKNTNFFTLNIVTAISVLEALKEVSGIDFKIKWPNDILAENKKVAGILIENSFKSASEITSIIGIGINVNQQNFENLPQASSLYVLQGKYYDRNLILQTVVNKLQQNLENISVASEADFWEKYHHFLFKKDIVSTFQDAAGKRFVGKISCVTFDGKLQVELEVNSKVDFDIKEIKMLY